MGVKETGFSKVYWTKLAQRRIQSVNDGGRDRQEEQMWDDRTIFLSRNKFGKEC